LSAGPLVQGAHQPRVFGLDAADPPTLTPKELAARMVGGGAAVVDLADSRAHRMGHIPASRFAIRAHMPGNLKNLPDKAIVVLTSPDGVLARLAVADAREPGRQVMVLEGGTAAWKAAGQPLAKGFKDALDQPVDVWYRPYDLSEGTEAKMREYLTWEVGLTDAIARDGTTRFRDFSKSAAGE
ncbi:MAG: rhodanese-like domain-containing protein, partial [Rhodospirillales bacterium]